MQIEWKEKGKAAGKGGEAPHPAGLGLQCGRGCSTMPGAARPCPTQDWCGLGSPSPPWGSPPRNGFEVGGLGRVPRFSRYRSAAVLHPILELFPRV